MEEKYSLLYTVFQQQDRPRWIKLLNRLNLAGLIATPIVFIGSVFLFDHPDNFLLTLLRFLMVNSYAVVIFLFSYLSYKFYPVNRWLGALFPLIPICGYIYLAILIFAY